MAQAIPVPPAPVQTPVTTLLTPFEVEEPTCPPIVGVALKALAGLVVGLAAGALIATLFPVSFIVAGSLCATVGFVAGLFYGFYTQPTPPIVVYRLKTIDQLETALPLGAAKTALLEIRTILAEAQPSFDQNYKLHTLHDRLTHITDQAAKERADIQAVWKLFLERLQGCSMQMPDGMIHSFDCQMETKRLKGEKPSFAVRQLLPEDKDFDKMIHKIYELEKVCFGRYGTFPPEWLKDPENDHLFVIVQSDQNDLLGFLYAKEVEEQDKTRAFHICGLGREPGAARLGIGHQLLDHLFFMVPGRAISLEVRESNASARKLYEDHGFLYGPKKLNYYCEPVEDALPMRRPVDGEDHALNTA